VNSEDFTQAPQSQHLEADTAPIDTQQARGEVDDAGIAAAATPPALTALAEVASDVAIGDWDDLLSAVKARLRLTVGALPASTPEPQAHDAAARTQASVLECVAALDQLHTTLTHELGRRQQLELEVFDAQTALAQARAELVGTQAGERRARHLALHDSLTSLPNGNFFVEQLELALGHAEPQPKALAVLYFDLDGFKSINDKHGHAAGDDLLRIVGARLTRAVRAADVVGRLGGDEFACLMADSPSRAQLSHLACKLFDAVSAPFQLGQLKLTVRPSIGIAMCPADGGTAETLLKNADAAMYRAKRQQSGYAFFDQLADE
jgi:diguanylate cyclase